MQSLGWQEVVEVAGSSQTTIVAYATKHQIIN